jgi:hypothetical protein
VLLLRLSFALIKNLHNGIGGGGGGGLREGRAGGALKNPGFLLGSGLLEMITL